MKSCCGQMLTCLDVFNAQFVIRGSQQRSAINTSPLQTNMFMGNRRFIVGGFYACHCICMASAQHTNTQNHGCAHAHAHELFTCPLGKLTDKICNQWETSRNKIFMSWKEKLEM